MRLVQSLTIGELCQNRSGLLALANEPFWVGVEGAYHPDLRSSTPLGGGENITIASTSKSACIKWCIDGSQCHRSNTVSFFMLNTTNNHKLHQSTCFFFFRLSNLLSLLGPEHFLQFHNSRPYTLCSFPSFWSRHNLKAVYEISQIIYKLHEFWAGPIFGKRCYCSCWGFCHPSVLKERWHVPPCV